ncbi:flagellar motor switch protein FliM [Immundisolibacter sp.]|uniref:flagellar motor switch protein FliM n=1 Tax=Immundisolibacter sp. TaxID=1934948 RepID=UPI002604E145|nr:FliM/FliN family flagellar motor switch protein [Immundisolibacter sp.]MDD3651311.1 FliM/FliN family flagellar motor switch protein [Immundisolibacter sp.]
MARDELVTPDELSALLDAAPARPGARGVEPYDLASRLPAQDGADLPALARITEYFCEGFTRSLGRYLGRDTLVSARGSQLREYRDFVHSLPERASVRGLELAPLPGNGVLALEPGLLFTVVESFFGGGRATAPSGSRDLTPTERRMLGNLLELLLPELKTAWSPLLPLSLGVAPSDVDPLLVSLIDPVEIVLVQSFEVALLGGGGDFHLALPMSALQGIWPALRAGASSAPADDGAWRAALKARLLDSPLTLRAEVARRQSTLRRVLTLQVGEVLTFERADAARLVVEGRPLFVGEFGVSNGNNAVSVTGRLPAVGAPGKSGEQK